MFTPTNNELVHNDSDESLYSYSALDTLALNDESDTEYFDAKGQLIFYSV